MGRVQRETGYIQFAEIYSLAQKFTDCASLLRESEIALFDLTRKSQHCARYWQL